MIEGEERMGGESRDGGWEWGEERFWRGQDGVGE
jgi:hypothetical protein